MTTLAVAGRSSLSIGRRWAAPTAFLVLALIDIFFFAHYAHKGDATLAFSQPFAKVTVPNLSFPGRAVAYVMGALSVVLAVARVFELNKVLRRVTVRLVDAEQVLRHGPASFAGCHLTSYTTGGRGFRHSASGPGDFGAGNFGIRL